MDLLDFSDCKLYFEDALPPTAEKLIALAAADYGSPAAELALLRANLLAPENLTVLVALYRYYFYQHRLDEVLSVAEQAIRISGRLLGISVRWDELQEAHLGRAAANSFGLLRFYLLALKAESIVLLRQGRIAESRERLEKLTELDCKDQLGASKLLEVIEEFQSEAASRTPPAPPPPLNLAAA